MKGSCSIGVRIPDVGGGTVVIALSLASMGYEATLYNLSSGQLRVAEEKLRKTGLLEDV